MIFDFHVRAALDLKREHAAKQHGESPEIIAGDHAQESDELVLAVLVLSFEFGCAEIAHIAKSRRLRSAVTT